MPKIIQFREECIGCNSCVEYASQYWKMAEDGKSELVGAQQKGDVFVRSITDLEVDQNVMAAMACPMKVIQVLDDSGKELS